LIEAVERRFISFDETPIFYRIFPAKEAPKAVVLIVHGMAEHGGRYRHVADYFSVLGYESLALDLRGFGKSGGKKGCLRQFSDYWKDLEALHRYALNNYKDVPVFILGHSFGGLIAASYISLYKGPKPHGLLLSSPLFGVAMPVPAWKKALALATSYIAPDFCQDSEINPAVLTHDTAILKADQYDTAMHPFVSSRLYRELLGMLSRKKEVAERLKVPVLILQASEDHIVDKKESLRFYDLLKIEDKEFEEIPATYHEILNEVNREKTLYRMGSWISRHLSS
jgi:lysophospholipase